MHQKSIYIAPGQLTIHSPARHWHSSAANLPFASSLNKLISRWTLKSIHIAALCVWEDITRAKATLDVYLSLCWWKSEFIRLRLVSLSLPLVDTVRFFCCWWEFNEFLLSSASEAKTLLRPLSYIYKRESQTTRGMAWEIEKTLPTFFSSSSYFNTFPIFGSERIPLCEASYTSRQKCGLHQTMII